MRPVETTLAQQAVSWGVEVTSQGVNMKMSLLPVLSSLIWASSSLADQGMRGQPEALADALAMVETMGGVSIWSRMKSIHFVHEWYPWNRMDTYIENEILDLTGPRSRADRKSEISHSVRAYSPEGGRWDLNDGAIRYSDKAVLAQDLNRAPFNFYQLVKAVAIDDPRYEVRYGVGDIPTSRRLEFYGPDGKLGGWVILNARKEPIVKATPEYRYTLGPLKRFGNLKIPAWGVYDNGWTRYELISVSGDRDPPDISLFLPPAGLSAKQQ